MGLAPIGGFDVMLFHRLKFRLFALSNIKNCEYAVHPCVFDAIASAMYNINILHSLALALLRLKKGPLPMICGMSTPAVFSPLFRQSYNGIPFEQR